MAGPRDALAGMMDFEIRTLPRFYRKLPERFFFEPPPNFINLSFPHFAILSTRGKSMHVETNRSWSEAEEIREVNKLRRQCQMPEISFRRSRCVRRNEDRWSLKGEECGAFFDAQFVGEMRRERFCPRCRYEIYQSRRESLPDFKITR